MSAIGTTAEGLGVILLRQWLIVTILSLRGERNERQSNLPKASVSRRSLRRSTPRDDRSISLSLIQLMYAGVIYALTTTLSDSGILSG